MRNEDLLILQGWGGWREGLFLVSKTLQRTGAEGAWGPCPGWQSPPQLGKPHLGKTGGSGLQESREFRSTPAWWTWLLQPVSSSVTWDLKGTSCGDTGGVPYRPRQLAPQTCRCGPSQGCQCLLEATGGQGLSRKLAWCSWLAVG